MWPIVINTSQKQQWSHRAKLPLENSRQRVKFQRGDCFVSCPPVLEKSAVSLASPFCSLNPDRHPQSHRKELKNLTITDIETKPSLPAYTQEHLTISHWTCVLPTQCNGLMSFCGVWFYSLLNCHHQLPEKQFTAELAWGHQWGDTFDKDGVS